MLDIKGGFKVMGWLCVMFCSVTAVHGLTMCNYENDSYKEGGFSSWDQTCFPTRWTFYLLLIMPGWKSHITSRFIRMEWHFHPKEQMKRLVQLADRGAVRRNCQKFPESKQERVIWNKTSQVTSKFIGGPASIASNLAARLCFIPSASIFSLVFTREFKELHMWVDNYRTLSPQR